MKLLVKKFHTISICMKCMFCMHVFWLVCVLKLSLVISCDKVYTASVCFKLDICSCVKSPSCCLLYRKHSICDYGKRKSVWFFLTHARLYCNKNCRLSVSGEFCCELSSSDLVEHRRGRVCCPFRYLDHLCTVCDTLTFVLIKVAERN